MRTRILLGTLLLTTAIITAFSIPAARALSDAAREAQELELQREASDAAARLEAGRERHEAAEAESEGEGEDEGDHDGAADDEDDDAEEIGERSEDDALGRRGDHEFGLYSPTGDLVIGVGPRQADAPVVSALDGRTATTRVGPMRVAAVPLADGGAVRAAEPASEADARSRAAVGRLALAAAALVLAAAIAAWFLARRLTRPLDDLRRTATRLGGGDFTATFRATGVAEVDDVGRALDTSARRIGDLVDRERRLTSETSHQLRTPLAGLRLALETELAAPRPDPSEVIVESLGAVDRLEAIVTTLTDLARDALPDEQVPLDDVARAAGDRWTELLGAARRRIVVDARSGAVVTAHRAALDTLVDVLVDNALHHGRGTVTLTTEAGNGAVRLVVADEGTCTTADDVLFARRSSSAGRTGIGLHLARTLAEAEGARLRLTSRDPTAFQVVVPEAGPPGGGQPDSDSM